MPRAHTLLPGRSVPSAVLRAFLLAIMLWSVVVLVSPAVWLWVGVAAAVIAVVVPRSCAAWVVVLCLAIGVMVDAPSPGRIAFALLAVTAIHQLAALTVILPILGAVQLGALAPTLARFMIVQAIAQPLAFLLLLGWSEPVRDGNAWAAALGAMLLMLGVVGFVVLSRRPAGEKRVR